MNTIAWVVLSAGLAYASLDASDNRSRRVSGDSRAAAAAQAMPTPDRVPLATPFTHPLLKRAFVQRVGARAHRWGESRALLAERRPRQ
ncbi:MAG: hypothetical protein ACRCYV_06255 [Aeromonas sp.]